MPVDATRQELGVLLGRVANGDRAAFTTLYDRTAADVFGRVSRILGRGPVAEHVTVEVYRSLWSVGASYDPNRDLPRLWLSTAVHRQTVDYLRRRGVGR